MLEQSALYSNYRKWRRQFEELEDQGITNPFFKVQEELRSNKVLVEGRERVCY